MFLGYHLIDIINTKKNIDLDNNRYNPNNYQLKLRQSNISFSQDKDKSIFKIVNMDLFCPIPLNYEQNKIYINLKSNLRKEH